MSRAISTAWEAVLLTYIGLLVRGASEALSPHSLQRQPAEKVSETEADANCALADILDARAEPHQALLQRTVSRPVARQAALEKPDTENLLTTMAHVSTAGAAVHVRAGAITYEAKKKLYGHLLDMFAELSTELGPGTNAPLDQDGYEELAKLQDPQQMEFFTRRLISQMGLRVNDYHGLLGFIPFFDGEKMTQSFDAMKDEISKIVEQGNGWATDKVSGASAPLTQDGYAQVSILANNREMAEFVRRVVSDLGLSVEDEGGLQGLSQWHSGDKSVQTFGDLQGELVNASKTTNSWLTKSKPCPGTGHPSEEELDQLQENSTWAKNQSDPTKLPGGKSGKHAVSSAKHQPGKYVDKKGTPDKSHSQSTEKTAPVSARSDSKADKGASAKKTVYDRDEIPDYQVEEEEHHGDMIMKSERSTNAKEQTSTGGDRSSAAEERSVFAEERGTRAEERGRHVGVNHQVAHSEKAATDASDNAKIERKHKPRATDGKR